MFRGLLVLPGILALAACGEATSAPGPADLGASFDAEAGDLGTSDAAPDAGLDLGLAPDLGFSPDLGFADDATSDDAADPDASAPGDLGLLEDGGVDEDAGRDASADLGVDAGPPDAGAPSLCAAYGAVSNEGVLANANLTELSGLAASFTQPAVLYGHNDSGGDPVIYLLSTTGADLGERLLDGATPVDWEDLALGPGPNGPSLYVGDIGDNGLARPEPYLVYRLDEPQVGGAPSTSTVAFEVFELEYPGGAHHNAEAMMVHPSTGDLYIVTKEGTGDPSQVYKAAAPLVSGAINLLSLVTTLAVPTGLDLPVTGGDIHPLGEAVLLRTYNTIYQFVRPVGPDFDPVFSAPFTRVPAAPLGIGPNNEIQGEAITWFPDGLGYYTASERSNQQLHAVRCQ